MPQQQLKLECEQQTYDIRLFDINGAVKLVYETMCDGDEQAIDKLSAIKDVAYTSFEITCGDALIANGLRHQV